MKLPLVVVLLMALTLSACRSDADQVEPSDPAVSEVQPAEQAPDPGPADVQLVEISVGMLGYSPSRIEVEAGTPVRLVLTRTAEGECIEQVSIPEYDIPLTDLPLNEPVTLEFTPTEAGEFAMICGMNMQDGTIVVSA